jgi:ABC-2 type transport system permease protein
MSTVTRLPGTSSIGWQRFRIELKEFFRGRESVIFTFSFPMLLLLVFGSVFSGVADPKTGVTYAQYFLAGMIASGLVYSGFQQLAFAIPMERDDGTLKRLRGTPMPAAAYFLGKFGVVLVGYVGQVVLLLLIGVLLFDVTLPSTVLQWFTLLWVSALGLVVCVSLGIAMSGAIRSGRTAGAVVTPIVLVLQFTSGVFFQFSQLPHWMQVASSFFPLKWLCQGMRSVFLPESFAAQEPAGSWELGKVAAVLTIWAVVGVVLALRGFRWQRREEI